MALAIASGHSIRREPKGLNSRGTRGACAGSAFPESVHCLSLSLQAASSRLHALHCPSPSLRKAILSAGSPKAGAPASSPSSASHSPVAATMPSEIWLRAAELRSTRADAFGNPKARAAGSIKEDNIFCVALKLVAIELPLGETKLSESATAPKACLTDACVSSPSSQPRAETRPSAAADPADNPSLATQSRRPDNACAQSQASSRGSFARQFCSAWSLIASIARSNCLCCVAVRPSG